MGTAATRVELWETGEGMPVARFRLAATSCRWDRRREEWTGGHTSHYTVWARKSLARNVAVSVSEGEPLVVQGELRVTEQQGAEPGGRGAREADEGQPRFSADIVAMAVGHDLARGTAVFRRVSEANPALTRPIRAV
jgi:single-strand DNA-binding protein